LEKNPKYSVTDIAKLSGEIWNKMTQFDKQCYYDLAEKDLVRYD
jgi:hypothetical protein